MGSKGLAATEDNKGKRNAAPKKELSNHKYKRGPEAP